MRVISREYLDLAIYLMCTYAAEIKETYRTNYSPLLRQSAWRTWRSVAVQTLWRRTQEISTNRSEAIGDDSVVSRVSKQGTLLDSYALASQLRLVPPVIP